MSARVRVSGLLLVLIAGTALLYLASASAAKPDESSRQLKNIKSEISTVERGIRVNKKRRDQSRQQLEATERNIAAQERALKSTETRISEKQGEIKRLEQRAGVLRTSFERHYQMLARHSQANIALGKPGYLKILLNQEDVSSLDRNQVYLDYINKARLSSIQEVRNDLTELGLVRERIVSESEQLKTLREQQASQQEQLNREKERYAMMIAGLDRDITSQGKKLEQLKADAAKLQDLIARLQRESEASKKKRPPPDKSYTTPPPVRAKGGSLPWPVDGRLLASYGSSRELGSLKWQGVVIGAQEGEDVRAISPGQVVFADWMRGYGQLIIIDHGGGLISLYGYNRSLEKNTGSWVKQGEVIARVGTSGGNDSPALYLEIRSNGKPKDPFNWLQLKN